MSVESELQKLIATWQEENIAVDVTKRTVMRIRSSLVDAIAAEERAKKRLEAATNNLRKYFALEQVTDKSEETPHRTTIKPDGTSATMPDIPYPEKQP